MDLQEFEQAVLKLAFESDAKLTTASVAYYLGIPSNRANELLDRLLEQGVLEIDSDEEGNLYYFVPQSHKPSSVFGDEADDSEPSDGELLQSKTEDTSCVTDEYSEKEAVAETTRQVVDGDKEASESLRSEVALDRCELKKPIKGYSIAARQRSDQVKPVDISETKSTDVTPDSVVVGSERIFDESPVKSGGVSDQSFVVDQGCRCEPRPLKEDRPVLASCEEPTQSPSGSENSSSSHGPRDSSGSPQPPTRQDVSLQARNEPHYQNQSDFVPQQQNRLNGLPFQRHKNHSHHPGMSLLLSLVLCGTGQIYNGEISKGVMMMILCFLMWFVLLGWVVHIWAIIDSVVVAERISRQPSGS